MKKIAGIISTIVICFSLSACGGGGGDGGGGSATPLGTNTTATTPTTPTGSATASLSIAKTVLVFAETTQVSATFTNVDGSPAAGVSVSFSTTLGSIPSAATTDSSGVASVTLSAGNISGQGSVTATALINNLLVTKTGTFTVQLPQLTLSILSLPTTALSFGASATVEVSVLDANGNVYTAQDVVVTFVSTQSLSGRASINSPITTVNGKATTTYTAISNSGVDTITASISGSSKTGIITVNPLTTSAIQFVSALPTQIGLKGINNGFPEMSVVTFKVINSAGQPDPNKSVTFDLDTSVGGITLSGITNVTPTSGTGSTDAFGLVRVNVQSGTIATSVRVTATITDTIITGTPIRTQSDQLVIASGLPAQDTMSISLSNLNSESWNVDGVTVSVTARLADHFKNPVKGTAITFTTSGGSIDPTCTTDATGACTVTWRSQNPRPLAFHATTNPGGPDREGQVMILAHAIGEEDFLDSDGNGLAAGNCLADVPVPTNNGTGLSPVLKCGEFNDWSEAYLDQNWNGVRDSLETFIDYNQDGVFNGPNGFFTGSLQDTASALSPRAKHIFVNTELVMSSSAAGTIELFESPLPVPPGAPTELTDMALGATVSGIVAVADVNGNTMPSGTVISLAGTGGLTVVPGSIIVPQNVGGTLLYGILLTNAATTPGSGGLIVSVTSPGGLVTSQSFAISWN